MKGHAPAAVAIDSGSTKITGKPQAVLLHATARPLNPAMYLRAAYHDTLIVHEIVIECVDGMPQLQHHVVGNIHHVVDAGGAGGLQAVFQPFGRRLNLHAANYARSETPAKFRRFDLDLDGFAGLGGLGFHRFRRTRFQRKAVDGADFARDANHAQAVGAIRGDFRVDHRAVRAVFDGGDIRAGESEPRGHFFGRGGYFHKFLQPVVGNLHALVLS
jgi:hypothetical protein